MNMANRSIDKQSKSAVRASISFPQKDYITLEKIAEDKKVSIAWVVREAVEKYIGVVDEKRISNE